MVISLLPDEGPSLRVETLFSKTFAEVSDSRVNYYYYCYYYYYYYYYYHYYYLLLLLLRKMVVTTCDVHKPP